MQQKQLQVIPEKEDRCVWMSTGVISCKLCTRNYRCETCIFDHVMRNDEAGQRRSCDAASAQQVDGTTAMNDALFFNQQHCWARVESAEKVLIGIDGILANFVARVKAVSLPRTGDTVTQGNAFAHIIQENHVLELASPLSGTVLSTNTALYRSPELVVDSSWESGWLIAVQPENPEHDLQGLMFGKKAGSWYQKREQEVIDTVAGLIDATGSGLGLTLQDGGTCVSNFADMLTEEQYCQVVLSGARVAYPA